MRAHMYGRDGRNMDYGRIGMVYVFTRTRPQHNV